MTLSLKEVQKHGTRQTVNSSPVDQMYRIVIVISKFLKRY